MNAFLRIAGILLAIAVIVLPVVAVVNGWIGTERFPLTKLRVASDAKHVDDAELQKVLAPFAKQGFFAVRLDDAQVALANLPWVEEAEVSKKWPDVLEVHIREHRPLALWDDTLLLSERGRLYPRSAMGEALPKGLPQLGGDARRVAEVLSFYNQSRELFAPLGLGVRELRQDARGSWSLRLSDGAQVIVGRQDAESRVRRFAELLPKLIAPEGRALQRADLRYANGFALKWSEAASPTVLPRKTA
ncbi:cell division protein FtsQ/DivIB [Solilutibacter tolerans]|uniref:Cell division protein FtsQ n=1 Tax=Solilutibacter tolerans TaxID=1604334 RepID=A0A1N6ND17_9GAMM|nr:cell division protein FtsQ/DivIB [Lysobacter tolerans]SIP89965.1 cell division protein FtsQ [Lysobacter tolerans]